MLKNSLIRLTTKLSSGKNHQHNKHASMRVCSVYTVHNNFHQIFFCLFVSRNVVIVDMHWNIWSFFVTKVYMNESILRKLCDWENKDGNIHDLDEVQSFNCFLCCPCTIIANNPRHAGGLLELISPFRQLRSCSCEI